jgi:hypothetical protein
MKVISLFASLFLFPLLVIGSNMGSSLSNEPDTGKVCHFECTLLSADTIIVITPTYCIGNGNASLASNSFSSYLWSTGDTVQTITVNQPGIYTVRVRNIAGWSGTGSIDVGNELVFNGNFSCGDTGFFTEYLHPYLYDSGYWITSNAQNEYFAFYGTDHTKPGFGLFMSVDGAPAIPQLTLWQEQVTVIPNTIYYFSFWARSMNNYAGGALQANLQYSINGTMAGTTGPLPPGVNYPTGPFEWLRFCTPWNSGANTSALLKIVDLETYSWTNDFGIDDISFSSMPSPGEATASNNSPVCNGDTINLTCVVTGGTFPYSFSWSGPDFFTSTGQNPVLVNASPAMGGTYTVTASDAFGCTATETTFVTVKDLPPAPVITLSGDTLRSNLPSGNQWYLNGTLIPGATGSSYIITQFGTYWDIAAQDGCRTDTSNMIIFVEGIQEKGNEDFSLTPVPNNGCFTVTITSPCQDNFKVSVYSSLGIRIYVLSTTISFGITEFPIDLRPLPNGNYFIVLSNYRTEILKRFVIIN